MSNYQAGPEGEITPIAAVPVGPIEDWAGFKIALLDTDFRVWAGQDPALAAGIAGALYAEDIGQARQLFARLGQLHPPTPDQLARWQAVANAHQIRSIQFLR